jgi:hypothetical protein
MIASALCLCLSLTLTGCAGRAVQSQIVEVPRYVDTPAACKRLRAVVLPPGSTAQDVIEAQHAALLEYERQIAECAVSPHSE